MPWHFVATKFIDTGYSDPVGWDGSYEITELYKARAYYANGVISNSGGSPGQFSGNWKIDATPCWGTDSYIAPAPAAVNNNRIFIKCDIYLFDPTFPTATYTCTAINWALYRA